MLTALKRHPFAVQTTFESSLVLTYAVRESELTPLIPECLQLDTLNSKWGFVALALVNTKDLRPKGFPRFLGNDFVLAGYRIFVRYTTSEGRTLRGLYIIKSETNKKRMSVLGNIFTGYNYTTTDLRFIQDESRLTVISKQSGINIEIDKSIENVNLPAASPFKDWKEARKFAGPLPFTFTYEPDTKKVLIIEGVRTNWIPKPVHVMAADVHYLKKMAFQEVVLANAFLLRDVPYYWKKGKTDLWK
jgi:uncharacterized protein YqjF (DUF2071 family)